MAEISSPKTCRSSSASPPPKCAICLGTCTNKCYSNSCMHQFCFTCLLKWSKVKAECPLCKQAFKSIIHNIKSNSEYDEHIITRPDLSLEEQNIHNNPFLFIPPAPPRHFQFRTTFTVDPRGELAIQQMLLSHPLTNNFYIPGTLTRRASSSTSFRRSIYAQNLWVYAPPDITGQYRNTRPSFFRENPIARNRLVPWLNRELNALLHENTQQVMHLVDVIMEHLLRYHIRDRHFWNLLYEYLDEKTDHFIHEFYNFMRSPFDMIGYDRHVMYTDRPESPTFSVSDYESDSDVAIVAETQPVTAENNPFRRPTIEVIEINSDSSRDSDVIVREPTPPEIVDLAADSDSSSDNNNLLTPGNSSRQIKMSLSTATSSSVSDNDAAAAAVTDRPTLPLKLRLKRKRQSREKISKLRKRRKRTRLSSTSSSTSTSSSRSRSRSRSSSSSSSSNSTASSSGGSGSTSREEVHRRKMKYKTYKLRMKLRKSKHQQQSYYKVADSGDGDGVSGKTRKSCTIRSSDAQQENSYRSRLRPKRSKQVGKQNHRKKETKRTHSKAILDNTNEYNSPTIIKVQDNMERFYPNFSASETLQKNNAISSPSPSYTPPLENIPVELKCLSPPASNKGGCCDSYDYRKNGYKTVDENTEVAPTITRQRQILESLYGEDYCGRDERERVPVGGDPTTGETYNDNDKLQHSSTENVESGSNPGPSRGRLRSVIVKKENSDLWYSRPFNYDSDSN